MLPPPSPSSYLLCIYYIGEVFLNKTITCWQVKYIGASNSLFQKSLFKLVSLHFLARWYLNNVNLRIKFKLFLFLKHPCLNGFQISRLEFQLNVQFVFNTKTRKFSKWNWNSLEFFFNGFLSNEWTFYPCNNIYKCKTFIFDNL